ncbi:MAG: AAA family ATPase, partial [Candidatus Omnitrophica bacterium]|nr:AAA family ATPase [Candidatus Omnitrophota bacterium]
LNIAKTLSIYNVLSKLTQKKARLEDIIQKVDRNFDIAPSDIILSTLEQELAGEIGRESRLWETFNGFRGSYDYILIDCPPNLGILTVNAIRASQEIIVPVEASRFSFEGLGQLTSIIALIQDRLNHIVKVNVVVTNFDSRLRHSFKMLDKIKANFKDKMFSTIIHVNVKLKEAQNQGTHVLNHDKYCRGAKDYFSLSREIIMQEQKVATAADVVSTPSEVLEKKVREIVKKKMPKLKEITFSLAAPEAREVFVAGDFNGWEVSDASRMTKDNGTWQKRVSLNNGKYRYRFVVDGQWIDDTNNPTKETNPFGTMDSLVEVGLKK